MGNPGDHLRARRSPRAIEQLINHPRTAGLRIVAGDYDSTAGDWRYEQIFFLDQRSFAFTAAALAMPAVVATQKETVDAATAGGWLRS